MKKNLFAVSFADNTIVASKTTLKKAGKPGTPEYKELMKLIAKHPTFRVVEKEVTTNDRKKTYHGLTIEMMKTHMAVRNTMSRFASAMNWLMRSLTNSARIFL